ncbi:phospholipase-like protein [Tanacetum coccineum]
MLGQQLEVEDDGNENVPLYYYITHNITIQFRRKEFCLVTGLRFGVENLGAYNDSMLPIPFRRWVFPSCLDGKHITCNMVLRTIDDKLFDRLHDDDAVSLCCLGILQLVLLGVETKRRIPDWMLRLANDRGNLPAARLTPDETEARSDWWISSRAYFDGRIGQAERVPRHADRQNMYEVPSELYRQFEEQKIALEKQKREIEEIKKNEADRLETYEKVRKFMEDMNVEQVRQTNKGPILVSEHYGISDLSEFPSMQGGPSSFQTHPNSSSFFNIGTPTHWQTPRPSQPGSSNWQTQMSSQPGPSNWQSQMPAQSPTPFWKPAIPSHPGTYNWQSPIPSYMGNSNLQPPIGRHHDAAGLFDQNILIQGKREQRPSFYKRSPYMEQPPSTVLPKKRGNKTKNNVKKSNLSPLNLGNALDDDNEGGDDVMFLGGQFTGNYLVYENVDVSKVRRENYVDYTDFLNNPEPVYLDCYMKGYLVPVTFWQQLVPHLCMPAFDSNTPMGWLSGEHMNSWMELLIRNRPNNAPWTVAYTNTISVHQENQRFLIETDQHTIGTLDGSTRPYPAWNDVNWVFMPIHVGGNHWVTGVIDLPNSHVYVFDSLPNEGRKNLLWNLNTRG